jgi:hypothetical protein
VRLARNAVPVIVAIVLFAACSSGDTQDQGGATPATGATAAGTTGTGPTATGATGETAGDEFDGPVSVDTGAQAAAGLTRRSTPATA